MIEIDPIGGGKAPYKNPYDHEGYSGYNLSPGVDSMRIQRGEIRVPNAIYEDLIAIEMKRNVKGVGPLHPVTVSTDIMEMYGNAWVTARCQAIAEYYQGAKVIVGFREIPLQREVLNYHFNVMGPVPQPFSGPIPL